MTRPDAGGATAHTTSAPSSASSPTTGEVKPAFRGDVQGLRAIAVLTVIAGHAGVPFLPGGFVGVDVFFVISGFLISTLLYKEVRREGRVSLREFYARRARRILPAATLVLVVTIVASVLWLAVVDALDLLTDALWATFFAANIHFSNVGTDYFAQEEGPSPLQHFWSLAVEEQFYVAWPLLLIACLLIARRRRPGGARSSQGRLPRLTVFWVLVGVGLASFVYGVWLTAHNPTAAYFSTPARAWELAVGAIAALVAPAVAAKLRPVVRGALTLAGLTAILLACVAYSEATHFPGTAALLPVLGSAAVLLAGAGGHEREPAPIRALAVAPMRVVGDWSYSLYLWHWPLLIIAAQSAQRGLTATERTGLVALTFVLAALTYRFVETPFRNPRRLTRPRALALYPASVALVATSVGLGSLYGHYELGSFDDNPAITLSNFADGQEKDYRLDQDPTVALVQASVIAAEHGYAVPSELRPGLLGLKDDVADVGACDYTDDNLRTLCPRGDANGDKTLVVLGNSHGRMWIPAFEKIAQREGYVTYYLVKPNCTGADLVTSNPSTGDAPWTACTDFREWAFEQIADLDPDVVVVSTSGPNPFIYTDDGKKYGKDTDGRTAVTQAGFRTTFERLKPISDRVILLRDVPKSEQEPGTCLTDGKPDLGDCMFVPMQSQEVDSEASMRAARQAGIDAYDPTPWLCWEDKCPVVIGDVLPYRDRGHISTVYSADLADELGTTLGLIPEDSR